MPFEVLIPDLFVHKQLAFEKEGDKVVTDDRVSLMYNMGDVIPDADVAPHVKKAYEDGDEHVRSCLKKVNATAKKETTNA